MNFFGYSGDFSRKSIKFAKVKLKGTTDKKFRRKIIR